MSDLSKLPQPPSPGYRPLTPESILEPGSGKKVWVCVAPWCGKQLNRCLKTPELREKLATFIAAHPELSEVVGTVDGEESRRLYFQNATFYFGREAETGNLVIYRITEDDDDDKNPPKNKLPPWVRYGLGAAISALVRELLKRFPDIFQRGTQQDVTAARQRDTLAVANTAQRCSRYALAYAHVQAQTLHRLRADYSAADNRCALVASDDPLLSLQLVCQSQALADTVTLLLGAGSDSARLPKATLRRAYNAAALDAVALLLMNGARSAGSDLPGLSQTTFRTAHNAAALSPESLAQLEWGSAGRAAPVQCIDGEGNVIGLLPVNLAALVSAADAVCPLVAQVSDGRSLADDAGARAPQYVIVCAPPDNLRAEGTWAVSDGHRALAINIEQVMLLVDAGSWTVLFDELSFDFEAIDERVRSKGRGVLRYVDNLALGNLSNTTTMPEFDKELAAQHRRAMADLRAHSEGTKKLRGIRVSTVPEVDVYAIRKRLGDTPEQFAARLGVTRDQVITWECFEGDKLDPLLAKLISLVEEYKDDATEKLVEALAALRCYGPVRLRNDQ